MQIAIELVGYTIATAVWAFFLCWVIQLFPHESTFPSISAPPGGRKTPYQWDSKVTQAMPFFMGPFVLMVLAVFLAAPSWRGLLEIIAGLGRAFMH